MFTVTITFHLLSRNNHMLFERYMCGFESVDNHIIDHRF